MRRWILPWVALAAWSGLAACSDDTKPSTPEPVVDMAEPPPPMDMGTPEPTPDAEVTPEVDMMAPADAAMMPVQIVAVETAIGSPTTTAGIENRVTCTVLADDGSMVADVETRIEVRPAEGWSTNPEDGSLLIGERAGAYQVTCTAPSLGLRDGTPTRWEVNPGAAASIRTVVEPGWIEAGGEAEVDCEAVDAYGNQVDTAGAVIAVSPENPGVDIIDRTIAAITADRYLVSCVLGGAAAEGDARLDVLPGLPSQLVAQLVPEEPVYALNQVITLAATATDIYGNPVSAAPMVWNASPEMPQFGAGRFLTEAEGRYTLSVEVDGPTLDDVPLSAEVEILVDGGAPAITCDRPTDGAMIRREGPIALGGQVADIAGLEAFEVDGQPVEVGADGSFEVQVEPAWGLNVHTVVARDGFGNENSTFCSYFAADAYLGEDAALFDAIALHLAQGAVDDGPPNDPITSLADLLRRVLSSQDLVNTLDATLSAQNPIVPNDCRLRDPIFGRCLARLGAEYRGMEVRGPNDLSANLLNGGLRAVVTIRNIRVSIRTTGTIGVGGNVSVSEISMNITFNIDESNGRPRVQLRQVNQINVGDIDLDIDGAVGRLFDGAVDLIVGAFSGLIRNELTNQLRSFLESELDALLSGILEGLDLAALGLAFEVPTFDGSPPINLALAVGLEQVNVNGDRMRIGINTRVNGDVRQPAPSAGVPLLEAPVRIGLDPAGSVGGAVAVGLINQVLHRLWRAAFFSFDDAGALLGGLPEGTEIGLQVRVPPAVEGIGEGQIRLHLGPAVASVVYPGLFDDPLRIRLATTVLAGVELVDGDQLVFGGPDGVQIERFDLVFDDIAMAEQARDAVERDLRRIIQAVADQALNDLLPSFPIPDFALPDDLQQYGVPAGTRLGLRGATLESNRTHFIVDGRFGQ